MVDFPILTTGNSGIAFQVLPHHQHLPGRGLPTSSELTSMAGHQVRHPGSVTHRDTAGVDVVMCSGDVFFPHLPGEGY